MSELCRSFPRKLRKNWWETERKKVYKNIKKRIQNKRNLEKHQIHHFGEVS